jgi:CRP-like cAMP-binding protein
MLKNKLTPKLNKSEKVVKFLSEHQLFEHSSPKVLEQITACIEIKEYQPGDILIEEGSPLACLGIIFSGTVDVTKQYCAGDLLREELVLEEKKHHIQQLKRGDLFGEMTFVGATETSATITAATPTKVILLPKEQLIGQGDQLMSVYNSIVAHISSVLVKRLQQTNQNFINSLQKNLIHEKMRVNAGKLVMLIIIATGVNNVAEQVVHKLHLNPDNRLVVWGMLILFALPSLYILNNSNYSKKDLGLDFTNWRPTVKRAAVISLALMLLLTGTKYILIRMGALTVPGPFFSLTEFLTIEPLYLTPILYMVSSGIQEFMTRGVLQGSIHRFLGQQHGLLAVIMTALYFSFMHFHFGVTTVLLVLIGGIFFGLIYLKDKNILGITIIHYFLGMMMSALGLMT